MFKDKVFKRNFIGFLIVLVLIFAGMGIAYFVNENNNSKVHEMTLDDQGNEGLKFSMTKYEQPWDSDKYPGEMLTQYNGEVNNYNSYYFEDWTIALIYPNPIAIDSLWNAEYVVEGNKLTLTPLDYTYKVEPGRSLTFGYVLATKDLVDINSIEIKGRFVVPWNESTANRVFISLLVVWFVAFVVSIVYQLRLISYRKRQERDGELILQTINTLVDFIEAKDDYTRGHSHRTAYYTKKISERLNISKEQRDDYYYIALLHDCGKVGIPEGILNKPGRLDFEEFSTIKSHTVVGASMLTNFTAIKDIQRGALEHHERYDGMGYPQGLKGEEISEIGRIICVADSFDAMNSDRCYRKRLEPDEIKKELKDNAGKQFDPNIVNIFLEMLSDGTISFNNSETNYTK